MPKLTLIEYNSKLACMSCCIADKGLTLLNKLKMGIACEKEFNTLKYYTILLEVIKCYNLDDTLTIDEQDCTNDFDYSFLVSRLEDFNIYCGIC